MDGSYHENVLKEKRLFCIYTERQNAERLIKKLRENEELEVR